ncbi:ribonuclease J [bacterium]|nr:ribonuclease J [bacterium]
MGKNKKIRLVCLGGIGEIGKNCNVVEYGNSAVLVDCGLSFPDAHMLGVDLVIPDFTYLLRNRHKLKAVVLTHGHEDHIGALPYLLQDMVPPAIYGTTLTLGLVRSKLSEFTLPDVDIPFHEIEAGDRIDIDDRLQIETFHVAHSIPDGLALAIHTPGGTIVHSGDFKLDRSPIDNLPTDIEGIEKVCKERDILALMVDTTNIERPGWTGSEAEVGPALAEHFSTHKGRIFITTFASNIHRIQQVLDLAEEFGRKVFLAGRTMLKNVEMARAQGYLRVPENILIHPDELNNIPPRRVVVLATGSQGEPMAALSQISRDEHRFVSIHDDDLVIFSASPIPGNETYIFTVINDLFKLGAEVVYGLEAGVHVSGHASREEIKMLFEAVKPRYVIPVHSQFRHQMLFRKLVEDWNHKPQSVIIMGVGDVLAMDKSEYEMTEKVKAGEIFIDGLSVGSVSSRILNERSMLAEDGVVLYTLVLDESGDHILSGPTLKSRGFLQERQNPELYEELRQVLSESLFHNRLRSRAHQLQLRNNLANALQRHIFRRLGLNPTIVGTVLHLRPDKPGKNPPDGGDD